MKKSEVVISPVYSVKVSVRILAESPHVGWIGRNQETGREARIGTEGRLRKPFGPTSIA